MELFIAPVSQLPDFVAPPVEGDFYASAVDTVLNAQNQEKDQRYLHRVSIVKNLFSCKN